MSRSFARSIAMFAVIAAIHQQNFVSFAEKQGQIRELGPYVSRGKGNRKSAHRPSGVRAVQRAAIKARNVKREKRFA